MPVAGPGAPCVDGRNTFGFFCVDCYMNIESVKTYRNIPYIDTKGLKSWHYQNTGRTIWLELPFIGFEVKLKRKPVTPIKETA